MKRMWHIIAKPVGRYVKPSGEDAEPTSPEGMEERERLNQSHVAVLLVSGGHTEVISRVGFARRHTKNPDTELKDQLKIEVDKARAARDAMAELLGDPETLR